MSGLNHTEKQNSVNKYFHAGRKRPMIQHIPGVTSGDGVASRSFNRAHVQHTSRTYITSVTISRNRNTILAMLPCSQ